MVVYQKLNLFKKGSTILIRFCVVDKNSATLFASDLFTELCIFLSTQGELGSATNTSSLAQKPGLNWSNYSFKHEVSIA